MSEQTASQQIDFWRQKLAALDCSRFKFFEKDAALGGDPESGFAQAFANLAYAYFKDRVPKLLPYLQGFQLLERNEDNTKAAGAFGFKIGDQWLVAPVFFLNGDLKGHELLYVKGSDTFVPLKESWVDEIASKRSTSLLQPEGRRLRDLNLQSPDMRSLISPPQYAKMASWEAPRVAPWMDQKVWQALTPMILVDPEALVKSCQDGMPISEETSDLTPYLKGSLPMLKTAWRLYEEVPAIRAGFDKFYGGAQYFVDLFKDLQKSAALGPSAPTVPTPSLQAPKPLGPLNTSLKPKKVAKKAAVSIKVDLDRATTDNLLPMTDKQREKLLRDGILVDDKREPGEITRAYNVAITQTLQNPTEHGFYDVLIKPGEFKKCLVLVKPSIHGGKSAKAIVIDTEGSKSYVEANPTEVWIRPSAELDGPEAWEKFFEGLPDNTLKGDSDDGGGPYVIIGPRGIATAPVMIFSNDGDGHYDVGWGCGCGGGRGEAGSTTWRHYKDRRSASAATGANKLVINMRPGSGLRFMSAGTYVPKGYKFVKLQRGYEDRLELSNQSDLQMEVVRKTARLKIYDQGPEVYISSQLGDRRLSKKAALCELILAEGLDESTSRELLKRAQLERGGTWRLNYGEGFPQPAKAAYAPLTDEPNRSTSHRGIPMEETLEQHAPVDELSSQMTDPNTYDPFRDDAPYPDQREASGIAGSVQSGKKDIFNLSTLSVMLKAVREDSIVDRYLGDLLKGLDRLGRIIYMFYWHNDTFQERYGKADLPEMEDAIRNTFEGLGDVVLQLKNKTVNPEMAAMSEPNLAEVAA